MAVGPGPTVVFDTDCVLCSGGVVFLLRHESDDRLRFVGVWSDAGRSLAERYGFTEADLDETFLVIAAEHAFVRSDAALMLCSHLKWPWRGLGALRIVPRPLRDAVYRFTARHRYHWFGCKQDCALIPPKARHRFLGV